MGLHLCVLTVRCDGCRKEITLPNSSKIACINGAKQWESNLAAVWGQMITGGGFTTLRETMSVLGVPNMTKKTFVNTEWCLGSWWWKLLEESMKNSGEEEKRLANARGNYHEGIPAITVLVDGQETPKHQCFSGLTTILICGNRYYRWMVPEIFLSFFSFFHWRQGQFHICRPNCQSSWKGLRY